MTSPWAEQPLVLTRPAAQLGAWREGLQRLGVRVHAWPLIEIAPASDPAAFDGLWPALQQVRLAFFASPNAVAAVMAVRPAGTRWPVNCLAACVGPGSAQALREAGVPVAQLLSPPPAAALFDSEALWPLLQAQGPWAGHRVLMLRGDGGREWLADRLRQAGAEVQARAVYARRRPQGDARALADLRTGMAWQPAPLWLLSSSEAVAHWQALAGDGDPPSLPPLPVLCTHARIAQAARAAGLRVREVAPTMAAVAAAWEAHVRGCGPLDGAS